MPDEWTFTPLSDRAGWILKKYVAGIATTLLAIGVVAIMATPAQATGGGSSGTTVSGRIFDEPNGCTSPLGDSPFPFVSFEEACDDHDICYITHPHGGEENGKTYCDWRFLQDMKAACEEADLPSWQLRLCYTAAHVYYKAVRFAGWPNFALMWDPPIFQHQHTLVGFPFGGFPYSGLPPIGRRGVGG
jgi:hypothetical protein